MSGRFSAVLATAWLLLLPGFSVQGADYGGGGCGLCGGGAEVDYDYGGSDGSYFMSDTDFSKADPNENFVLRGSVGVTSITAHEKVYASTTGEALLSRLDWTSLAPIATGDIKARFGDGWTLRGHVDASIGGDSSMTDYDWLLGYSPDLWTHRSISPNTSLDWYLNGSVAMGRDLPVSDALTVNVNAGLKYTDVQWTAVGGTYLYSVFAFRDTAGTLPDVPGIRYRMRLPTGFVGVDASVKDGPWSLDTTAKYGLTVMAGDTDYHYLRAIRFEDQLNWAQVIDADARVGFAFNDHLGAFLEGSYERMVSGHGDEDAYSIATGAPIGHYENAAGADLQVASLKLGLKGNF